MRLSRRKLTHLRHEPWVGDGTTYAFEYKAGELVIGRRNMHRLILAVSESGRELDELLAELVDPSARNDSAYSSKATLMIDLVKLVKANVLEVTGRSLPAGPCGAES